MFFKLVENWQTVTLLCSVLFDPLTTTEGFAQKLAFSSLFAFASVGLSLACSTFDRLFISLSA